MGQDQTLQDGFSILGSGLQQKQSGTHGIRLGYKAALIWVGLVAGEGEGEGHYKKKASKRSGCGGFPVPPLKFVIYMLISSNYVRFYIGTMHLFSF